METLDNDVHSSEGAAINPNGKEFLLEGAKWAGFLAIVGFIMVGLMAVGSLFVLAVGSSLGGVQGALGGIISLAMISLYFFPTLYLYNFSVKIKKGLNSSIQSDIDSALENLKKMFKFMGIMMIVVLSFYILMIIFGIGAGAML